MFALANTNAYTIPLFYENTNFESTFYPHFIQNSHKGFQVDSSNYVKNWWKTKGKDKSLDDFKLIKNKLKNFPSINFISIEESQDRRDILLEMFKKHGIYNATPHIYKKYKDEDHKIIEGPIINDISKGPVTSHLKTIKAWYEDTDEEYTFICEDDISFDTVQYWNFTWDEFLLSLPLNWECVQLSLVREQMFTFYQQGVILRPRCWCDWSACAYLIKRSHAKKLIGSYYRNGEFTLNYKGSDYEIRLSDNNHENFLRPIIETIVFTQFTNEESIFTFPLFVEDSMNFSTTWCDNENSVNTKSYLEIIDWWKSIGSKLTLDQINPYKLENKDI